MNPLLTKLSQFVGYGAKDAKVIFMGLEEKTNDDDDAKRYEKRLAIQSELEPFTDLAELCEQLKENDLYNPQKSGPQPQPTWAPLCSVMLGINGNDQIGDKQAVIKYQIEKLGKIDGDNLLAELLPVPKSGTSVFRAIHRIFLGFSDKEKYHEAVLWVRRKVLAEVLKKRFAEGQNSPPRLIVAYGRPWRDGRPWGEFEDIFEQAVGPVKFDGSDNRFKWAKLRGCLFVLTYHPQCRDECKKFGTPVARRIVEIYAKTGPGTP